MKTLTIENVALGQIRAYAKNAKNHPESQIQQIAASIQQFGFNNPILVDENLEIIAGHGRMAAAQLLGLDTVPVIRLAHLSDAQKRTYRLADNKIAENGGWNADLLRWTYCRMSKMRAKYISVSWQCLHLCGKSVVVLMELYTCILNLAMYMTGSKNSVQIWIALQLIYGADILHRLMSTNL